MKTLLMVVGLLMVGCAAEVTEYEGEVLDDVGMRQEAFVGLANAYKVFATCCESVYVSEGGGPGGCSGTSCCGMISLPNCGLQ